MNLKTLKVRVKDKHAETLRKMCTRCKVEKPIDEFGIRHTRGGTVKSECKQCGVSEQSAWARKNPERAKAAAKRWREANPDYKLHKHRLDSYGLSREAFQSMWDAQDGKCAICAAVFADERASHVDHCHSSKVVRGLLCRGCNVGLGVFQENTTALASAIAYLDKHAALNIRARGLASLEAGAEALAGDRSSQLLRARGNP